MCIRDRLRTKEPEKEKSQEQELLQAEQVPEPSAFESVQTTKWSDTDDEFPLTYESKLEEIREKRALSEGKKQAAKHVEEELFTQTQYKSFFAAELEKSTRQSREKLSANDSYRSRNVTHRPRSTASMGETVTSVSDRVRRLSLIHI